MKKLTGLAVLVFVAVFAVTAASRMSDESLAVALGVLCGVVAAVPASLLITAYAVRKADSDGP